MRLPSISLVYSLFSCYLRRMTCDDLLRCYYARPTCDVIRIFVYKQIKGLSDSSIFLSAILVFILKFSDMIMITMIIGIISWIAIMLDSIFETCCFHIITCLDGTSLEQVSKSWVSFREDWSGNNSLQGTGTTQTVYDHKKQQVTWTSTHSTLTVRLKNTQMCTLWQHIHTYRYMGFKRRWDGFSLTW